MVQELTTPSAKAVGHTAQKCVDCGRERTLTYDTHQCHECEAAERERELDAMDDLIDQSVPSDPLFGRRMDSADLGEN